MKKINNYFCEYGYGRCFAPSTECPHWQGTFCELDVERKELKNGKLFDAKRSKD